MAFTDDDLKQLKQRFAEYKEIETEVGCVDVFLDRDTIEALVYRLETAERAVDIAREVEHGINGISWKYFKVAYDAWRKAMGK